MLNLVRPALSLYIAMTIITGAIYPALVTGISQVVFPWQANGSLITKDGKVIGSALIGQEFNSPKYFWGRLSATSPAYNGGASSGSNLGPLNPALTKAVSDRIAALKTADPENAAPVPIDLVTASGSGLDPHISIAAAKYQAARVAKARGMESAAVEALIASNASRPILPGFGEPIVNVLALNLALDGVKP